MRKRSTVFVIQHQRPEHTKLINHKPTLDKLSISQSGWLWALMHLKKISVHCVCVTVNLKGGFQKTWCDRLSLCLLSLSDAVTQFIKDGIGSNLRGSIVHASYALLSLLGIFLWAHMAWDRCEAGCQIFRITGRSINEWSIFQLMSCMRHSKLLCALYDTKELAVISHTLLTMFTVTLELDCNTQHVSR